MLLIPALLIVGERVGATSPQLTAPTQVVAGERITVTGRGFPRNARLLLAWDGSRAGMASTRSNRRGEVRVGLVVPSSATAGRHVLAAISWDGGRSRREAGPVLATATIEVIHAAVLDSTPAARGSQSASATPTVAPTAAQTQTPVVTPTAAPPIAAAPPPTAAPAPTAPPAAPAPPAVGFTATTGVWINQAQLQQLPTSGAAWNSVVSSANVGTGANISDQDSNHDQETLAAAIYAARTGQQRDRAVAALQSAIGTEQGGRWLAVGRNLTGYVIAADLLGIRSGPIYDWLASFRTMRLAHNNSGAPVTFRSSTWDSGSNASAQAGAAYVALAVYLGDGDMLRWSWDAFRRYAGDRSSPHRITSNSDAWQAVPNDPVGIQNVGATKNGCSIAGAISNDMSRGGEDVCNPGSTQYPWVGLEGAVPAAMILSRAGYPAWDVADQALRRAAVYLHGLSQSSGAADWYDDSRADEIKHLLNRMYGLGYPGRHPVGAGRVIGFTDYTHP